MVIPTAILAVVGWLVRHERLTEAQESLERLSSGENLNIDHTIAVMQHVKSVEKNLGYGGASFADLFKGSNRRRTEICCMVWSCQASCGATLTGYAPYLLEQAGFESSKSFSLATGMYGLGIFGGIASWFCRLLLADDATNWVLGCLIIFVEFTYNLTISPTCYVIVAEIPSTRLRVRTVAFARVVYNLFTIVNNVVAPQLLIPTAWGLAGKSCLVYAVTSFLCLIWCYFRLPETKKLSYLELDLLFDKRAPTAKFEELHERLTNSAYLSASRAERMNNAWHGWLAY
ncbi:hypothetical protein FZEAL_4073 [Fusarium zealandicum]|uniref:Major facilitator superfamily (MFS) profile domain-containing protein n=1 Tax=Fusarium zealandicum TaxID=1053134 RepID=A0A8H4UN75_9HYPO|nr:hypothetical protein FZEAL_4073 [Fusarium zealandicum]